MYGNTHGNKYRSENKDMVIEALLLKIARVAEPVDACSKPREAAVLLSALASVKEE